MNLLY